MIARSLTSVLQKYATLFPVVSVLGPRQSGKTTLCRAVFSEKPYVSLENIDTRNYALSDPRGFLSQYSYGAIFDEIQNVPHLFSYLQEIVDEKKENGLFILTGSQNFLLSEKISQSLAGRTTLLTLLPCSNTELFAEKILPVSVWERVWKGGYPKLYNENILPSDWLPFYIQTYLERDIRSIINIGDLSLFSRFLQLLASHTAQELNTNTLSSDLGISHNTVKKWVGILEQSYIVTLLPPWFSNIKKRLVKSPKIHFLDSGLLCSLLSIHSPEQLQLHPLKGAIFESWVVSEMMKKKYNRASLEQLFHYRENNGIEFDLLVQNGMEILPYEIKASQTVHSDFFRHFLTQQKREKNDFFLEKGAVIFAGEEEQKRSFVEVKSWKTL